MLLNTSNLLLQCIFAQSGKTFGFKMLKRNGIKFVYGARADLLVHVPMSRFVHMCMCTLIQQFIEINN